MSKFNEEQFMSELEENGLYIKELDDLITINKNHKHIVPIVLKYLETTHERNIKDLLVRSLGVRGFFEASQPLIKEYYQSNDNRYKWVIGNTLSLIVDPKSLPQLLQIAREKEHGTSRQMIVNELWKYKKNLEEIKSVLLELINDKDVQAHAIYSISRMKDKSVIPYIEPFLSSDNYLTKKEAKNAIARLKK